MKRKNRISKYTVLVLTIETSQIDFLFFDILVMSNPPGLSVPYCLIEGARYAKIVPEPLKHIAKSFPSIHGNLKIAQPLIIFCGQQCRQFL